MDAADPWDRNFVGNPSFRNWLTEQLAGFPIAEGRPLLDYVTERLHTIQGVPPQEATTVQPADTVQPQQTYAPQSNGLHHEPPQMTVDPSQLMSPPASATTAKAPPKAIKAKREPKQATPPVASTSRATAKPTGKVPKEPWTKVYAAVKSQLDAKSLTAYPLRSAKAIVDAIEPFGPNTQPAATVPASGRLDVLNRMLNNGTAAFFAALNDQPRFREILELWTREAAEAAKLDAKEQGKPSDRIWANTLQPALKLWEQLPVTVEQLLTIGIGVLVRTTAKDFGKDSDIHDRDIYRLAFGLNKKWRALLDKQAAMKAEAKRKVPDSLAIDDQAAKKRKVSPSAAAGLSSSAGPGKAPPTVASSNGLTSFKALSGLNFGKKAGAATDDKPALPKHAATTAFAQALSSLSAKPAAAPEQVPSPSTSRPSGSGPVSVLARGKKHVRKSVRFAPEGELEKIKLIDRAIYDDPTSVNDVVMDDVHAMDMSEGAALAKAWNHDEDKFPWVEPKPVLLGLFEEELAARVYPQAEPNFAFGTNAAEVQAAREANTPEFVYVRVPGVDPPWTPDEPPFEPVDTNVAKRIDMGPTLANDIEYKAALAAARRPATQTLASDPEISSLLAKLTGGISAAPGPADTIASLLSTISQTNPSLLTAPNGLSYDGASSFGPGGFVPPAPTPARNSSYGSHSRAYGERPGGERPTPKPADPSRPDKRRQIVCKFYQTDECMYGSDCPFRHVK